MESKTLRSSSAVHQPTASHSGNATRRVSFYHKSRSVSEGRSVPRRLFTSRSFGLVVAFRSRSPAWTSSRKRGCSQKSTHSPPSIALRLFWSRMTRSKPLRCVDPQWSSAVDELKQPAPLTNCFERRSLICSRPSLNVHFVRLSRKFEDFVLIATDAGGRREHLKGLRRRRVRTPVSTEFRAEE